MFHLDTNQDFSMDPSLSELTGQGSPSMSQLVTEKKTQANPVYKQEDDGSMTPHPIGLDSAVGKATDTVSAGGDTSGGAQGAMDTSQQFVNQDEHKKPGVFKQMWDEQGGLKGFLKGFLSTAIPGTIGGLSTLGTDKAWGEGQAPAVLKVMQQHDAEKELMRRQQAALAYKAATTKKPETLKDKVDAFNALSPADQQTARTTVYHNSYDQPGYVTPREKLNSDIQQKNLDRQAQIERDKAKENKGKATPGDYAQLIQSVNDYSGMLKDLPSGWAGSLAKTVGNKFKSTNLGGALPIPDYQPALGAAKTQKNLIAQRMVKVLGPKANYKLIRQNLDDILTDVGETSGTQGSQTAALNKFIKDQMDLYGVGTPAINEAESAPEASGQPAALSEKVKAAVAKAKSNPNDPRSQAILQKYGSM